MNCVKKEGKISCWMTVMIYSNRPFALVRYSQSISKFDYTRDIS